MIPIREAFPDWRAVLEAARDGAVFAAWMITLLVLVLVLT